MSKSIAKKAFDGLKWTSISSIASILIQLAYTSIMAHILTPADFGLLTMALVVSDFGGHFTKLGIGQAIIQKETLTKQDIRAAFSASLFLSILIYTCIFFSAPWIEVFYHTEGVAWIIRLITVSLIFTGLSSTSLNILRRQMQFGKLSMISIASFSISYLGIGVSLAYAGFGVWSLVWATLSVNGLVGLFTYLLVRHPIIPTFVWKHYVAMLDYGSRMTVNTILEYFSLNLNNIIIGRLLGKTALGFFSRAFMLINLPLYGININVHRVIFPAFSQLQSQREKLREAYLMSITLMALILFPITMGVSAAANELVLVILGAQWGASIPLLQVLAPALAFRFLMMYSGIVCDATATLGKKMIISVSTLLIDIVLFIFMGWQFGLIGFAWGILISEIIRSFLFVRLLREIIQVKYSDYYMAYVPSLTYGLIVGAAIYGVKLALFTLSFPIWVIFIFEMLTGGVVLLFLILLFPHKLIKEKTLSLFNRLGILENKHPLFRKFISFYTNQ